MMLRAFRGESLSEVPCKLRFVSVLLFPITVGVLCVKVLFCPFWEANAYHTLLAESLTRHGTVTEFARIISWGLIIQILKKQKQIDVVHMHGVDRFIVRRTLPRSLKNGAEFLLKLSILRLSGVTLILTVHNLFNHEKKFARLELLFNRIVSPIVHGIIAHSEYAKREIAKTYNVTAFKIHVIPHGHYLDAYPRDMSREEARTRLRLASNDFVFLYFGLIRPYKGIPELIESFASLNMPHTKLLVTGRPFREDRLSKIQRLSNQHPNVRLTLGYIPDEEVQVYMNAADIVVFPFRDVFTSGSVILAMSFAKPVIASAKGSIPEMVNSNGGFLFKPEDKDGMNLALEKAYMTDRNTLHRMGNRNLHVINKFGWDQVAAQTFKIYEKFS
jgi:beta-1,4-mannosyltransferase